MDLDSEVSLALRITFDSNEVFVTHSGNISKLRYVATYRAAGRAAGLHAVP